MQSIFKTIGIRLSASAMLAGALAIGGAARATTFGFTDTVQTYDVSASGIYDITAAGGQGGAEGGGAVIGGDVNLTAGETLIVLVGGEAGADTVGGGGGTFVSLSPAGQGALDNLLVVAGGGSGGFFGGSGGLDLASGAGTGEGGAGEGGAGGGGVLGQGAGAFGNTGGGAYSGGIAAGGAGENGAGGDGGAGGGGGTILGVDLYYYGGGGGGYTGGSGGLSCECSTNGGGGSSYLIASATEVVSIAGGNMGDGSVIVDYVGSAVPEASTWAMMLLGFGGLGLAGYRTRARPQAHEIKKVWTLRGLDRIAEGSRRRPLRSRAASRDRA
jgi:hypothetical protein